MSLSGLVLERVLPVHRACPVPLLTIGGLAVMSLLALQRLCDPAITLDQLRADGWRPGGCEPPSRSTDIDDVTPGPRSKAGSTLH